VRPLTARERRLLALGLLVLAIGLFWLAVIGPLVGGFLDRAQERRDLWAAQRRNERLIGSLPALRVMAEAQQRLAPRFATPASGEAAASEAFKERLRHLATDEGLTIRGIEDLPADIPGGAVKVRADLTLTLTQLYETVRRLQSEDAYVVVDYLSVTADRSLAAGRLAPIDVRLELSSAWRPTRGRP
jgi:general secretion pathway protein M